MTLCVAKSTRTGKPCQKQRMEGMTVCATHGGSVGRVRAAAERRLSEQKARATAAELITRLDGTIDGDPLVNLVRMVTVAATAEQAYARLLQDEGAILTEVDYGKVGGVRVEPHPLLKLWNEERDRLAKISKLALDAGVAQRQLKIAEGQATVMVDVVFAVIDGMGLQGDERDRARRMAALQLRVIDGSAAPSTA